MQTESKPKKWIFSKIHNNKLIYNTCWEDPRCDRMMMDFEERSKIVMITSAGCNALDYLLDSPAEIHCVDMNFRQNSLLELKKSGLKNLDYNTFFELFGMGASAHYKEIYQQLRPSLPSYAQEYWDKYIKYFSNKGIRKSFYYRGTSGLLAFGLMRMMKLKKRAYSNMQALLHAVSLEEQSRYFDNLVAAINNTFVRRFVNSHYTMTLAGVPQNQQNLIQQDYEGGTWEYVTESLRRTFTTLDVHENYFYKVYCEGSYSKDCCPEYLKTAHFDTLAKRVGRIQTYTTTISDFLKKNPHPYTHYVLLDHQDWLAANAPEALYEEWELILKNSVSGTKILLRSAAKEVDFFPDFVLERVRFDQQKSNKSQQFDRVGTYASTYIGTVQ